MEKHPDFAAEELHLATTIADMQLIIEQLQQDIQSRGRQIGDSLKVKDEISAYVHSLMRNDNSSKIYDIEGALASPYFGRVDFKDDDAADFEKFHIGRVKVARLEIAGTEDILVFDWRDPVSTIFYECHGGRASYEVLGRYQYSGDVRLKRQYKIEQGELKQIVDDYILDQVRSRQEQALIADPLLRERLLAGTGDKLKDIVVSIQSEQNKIIRETLHQVMVIQGVAGSGKSTVGLHRLSYLLYNEKLDPQKLIIIAPNRIFLDYISELLPEIDAADVRQMVWDDLAAEITQQEWSIHTENRLELLLSNSAANASERTRLLLCTKLKGSPAFLKVLETYWERKIEQFCLKLTPVSLFDGQLTIDRQQQIDKFMEDSRTPYNDRLRGLMQYIRFRIRNFLEVRGAKQARSSKEDPALERFTREGDEFLERHFKKWEPLTLLTAYQEVYKNKANFKVAALKKEELPIIVEYSLSLLQTGQVEREDLAPLCYLKALLDGWQHVAKFNHIVVDEAQDMNAFEFTILKMLSANKSFTIMGDLSQGIHTYRSIDSWQTLLKEVFGDTRTVYREILYSYRSAKEIVDLFNKVMPAGSSRALPVYEVGRAPVIEQVSSNEAGACKIIEILDAYRALNFRSIGIITKLETESNDLYQQLQTHAKAVADSIHLVTGQAATYRGGISLLPVTLAKGLEFDAVIIWNASAKQYTADTFDARLLYVALSRAMHSLHVLYQGNLTPLLR